MPNNLGVPGVVADEVPGGNRSIQEINTSVTGFVDTFKAGPKLQAVRVFSFQEFEESFGGIDPLSEASYAVYQFFLNGGIEARIVRIPGKRPKVTTLKRGLDVLNPGPLQGPKLLCLPAAATLRGKEIIAVYSKALEICEKQKIFMIVDAPLRIQNREELVAWLRKHGSLRHPNAAMYFPALEIPDPILENRTKTVVPSGTIAGVYARNDQDRGVWKTPAGRQLILKGVLTARHELSGEDCERIVLERVNYFKNLPGGGMVPWGGRTLGGNQTGGDWKYISSRRTMLMISDSIENGTRWAIFEPNNEALWSRIRTQVTEFLFSYFQKGAFLGPDADEAFFVRCGAETTSKEDQEKGILNILVGIALKVPGEFQTIQIQQQTGQQNQS